MWKQDIPITEAPYFSTAAFQLCLPVFKSVCVLLCVYAWGFSDSLFPIVLSFLPHSHSASCGVSCPWVRESVGRERERERKVKCKEGKEREMREKKGGGSLRLVQNWCKNTKHCVYVCCYSEFSRWEQLIYSPLFRKGCVLQILDVCESDDGGGGWCYCDSVRMQWMWFYLLPLIVPSEHTADLHLSKVKVTILNEVWLSFFRCLHFDYIISTDSQINIRNLISKRRHFAHKVYRVLSLSHLVFILLHVFLDAYASLLLLACHVDKENSVVWEKKTERKKKQK